MAHLYLKMVDDDGTIFEIETDLSESDADMWRDAVAEIRRSNMQEVSDDDVR